MFPYGTNSKCGLAGEQPRGNWAQRLKSRGRDDYKFDIPPRVWIERLTKKESVAKCGLPDEKKWALEKRKPEWRRARKRGRHYLNVSLPSERAQRPGELSSVLNKPLAENQVKQLALSTSCRAEGSYATYLSLSLFIHLPPLSFNPPSPRLFVLEICHKHLVKWAQHSGKLNMTPFIWVRYYFPFFVTFFLYFLCHFNFIFFYFLNWNCT